MKALKSLLALAFIGLATSTASAQFANSSSNSSTSGSSIWTTVNTDGYNRIYVSYLPSKLKTDGAVDAFFDGLEELGLNGIDDITKMKGSFEVGYLRGIGLTSKVPLYLEVGGALQFRSSKWDYSVSYDGGSDAIKIKGNMLSLNIPVSLAYRININDDFAISPNFGFDFRINLTGKLKGDATYSYSGETEEYKFLDIDLFKDQTYEDLEGYEAEWEGWKRFQAGWHIGVGFDYRALHLGVKYGTDFNELTENLKVATTSVTLGWNF